MSSFQTSTIGVAGSLLRGAGSLLGGVFGQAASGAYEVQRAATAARSSALGAKFCGECGAKQAEA
jgi:hypothetical protein